LPGAAASNNEWQADAAVLYYGEYGRITAFELDFGGFGKEYAVDRVLLLLNQAQWRGQFINPLLINFGGDIATNGALPSKHAWSVG